MTARRRRAHARLAALPGVRSIRRPVGDGREFDLYYVRSGPRSPHPLLVVPGGPGAASVALYRVLRRRFAAAGVDVIMVEHRGVGLSRHDDDGADLPPAALTVEAAVDDLAAVLDDADVPAAVVYGTSYGSYLASGMGVRHPQRVHALVLDSPLLSADDIDLVREQTRRVLWDGVEPGTTQLAAKVRRLVADGVLTPAHAQLAAGLYGYAGPDVLGRQFDLLLDGHDWLWGAVGHGTRLLFERKTPYHHEPDLVGRIGYRELNYGAVPDGGPLDPAVALRDQGGAEVDFVAEPFDLIAAMPGFAWPTVVLAGGRDLVTPPAVAHRIAGLIPGATLVELPTAGHSILDARESAALRVVDAVYAGSTTELASAAASLDAEPAPWAFRLLARGLGAAAAAEAVVPTAVPRAVRGRRGDVRAS